MQQNHCACLTYYIRRVYVLSSIVKSRSILVNTYALSKVKGVLSKDTFTNSAKCPSNRTLAKY